MNILLISQCGKRALTETRRILDQFAERRGDRTWQTSITQAGLDTLRKMLRKTARKNTAVACHWIRGIDHSELLWIVGDASRFNLHGATPTNTTTRNVLQAERENDWHTAEDIRLLAQLAALLHDIGKATVMFQRRLKEKNLEKNVYRHEWISLRLFEAFVGDDDDPAWLQRLASGDYSEEDWISPQRLHRDGLDPSPPRPFAHLPPLAAAVGWLVLTHHRLPVVPVRGEGKQKKLGTRTTEFNPTWLESPLALVEHDWNEEKQDASPEQIEQYWQFAGPLPVTQRIWKARAAKLAQRLSQLHAKRNSDWLDNPYVMHIARLSLMLADHHYSSLPRDSARRVEGDKGYPLYANTDSDGLKQALDEHHIGVARDAGMIAHALPDFEQHLPRLGYHRGLRKRNGSGRYAWQDKAADAAAALRSAAHEQGAFIVNMASTGCGKTLANARILYALSDPQQGLRATYALGLRTLTMQTGSSFRRDLHLDDDDLAVLVGGSASRALFEYREQMAEDKGSASTQALLEEDVHVHYEGNVRDHPLLSRAMEDQDIRKLLMAPMLVCTVDHLVPATESLRAGRQIAPMLRLMSGDLILDELDDYDLNDLPALTRLVHWAGMLGTRVVLSSATLPPSLVLGMFLAYRAGRAIFLRNRRHGANADIPCLWVDEFGVQHVACNDKATFSDAHGKFIRRRVDCLQSEKVLRRGELLPLSLKTYDTAAFAQQVLQACLRLHEDHAEVCPVSGKRVSFGLVRMANIEPLFDVAQALFRLDAPEDTRLHICVYHTQFPLVQRSAIERQLDTVFSRHDAQAVYHLPDIRSALDTYPESSHLFIVLASPVCEVGRDWDVDWAVVEPSSMRSLIQLAGRLQRHRKKEASKPNVLIFDTNLRHFKSRLDGKPAYIRPGFEKEQPPGSCCRLEKHFLSKLLEENEYRVLNAIPRIQPRSQDVLQPQRRLVDLEHARCEAAMLPGNEMRIAPAQDAAAYGWCYPQAALTGVLQQQQPFRFDPQPSSTLVFLPDDDEDELILHAVEDESGKRGRQLYVPAEKRKHLLALQPGRGISAWGEHDLLRLLREQAGFHDEPLQKCAEKFATVEVPKSENGWHYHPWLGFTRRK